MRILSRLPGLHILDVDIYALDGLGTREID